MTFEVQTLLADWKFNEFFSRPIVQSHVYRCSIFT